MSILVVGTVALDTVETPFGQAKDILGGSAAYFSTAASFFSKVKLIAVVGKDFPQEHIGFLEKRGIDTTGLQVKEGKTFRWSGAYSYDLNNPQTLKTELNLLSSFQPEIGLNSQNERFVFLANIDPEIQLQVLTQVKKPELIVTDTMNYWIENKKEALTEVIKKSDILILNDAEAREYSKESNLVKSAKQLLSLGPRLVIIKRGEYGCSLFSRTLSFCVPAFLLENVLDPTGAGDSFAGGFLGYLASCAKLSESSFKKAVAIGTIIASYTVQDFSLNRLAKLTEEEINNRFEKFKEMTCFSR